MEREYNSIIAAKIKAFLNMDGWNYNFDEEAGIFRFSVNLRGKMKSVHYLIGINENDYNVYAISLLSADQNDPEQMRKMAEFTCRANFGLRNGNFELDFEDGELRYKCFTNCEGCIPTMDMIESSVRVPAAMFEHYSDGILRMLFADLSAEEAIRLCDGPLTVCSGEDDGAPAEDRPMPE